MLTARSLFPPSTVGSAVWLIRRADIRPDRLLRPMIRGTRRRRRKLHHLKLINTNDSQAVQVLHELEVRPTARQRLALLVMCYVDMVEHEVPGPPVRSIVEPFPWT
jgi:hypothetical protein